MPARIIHGGRYLRQITRDMEGVFAVDKPPSVSSAGVLRNLQEAFNPSKFFAPWLGRERARLEDEYGRQRGRSSWKQRRKLQNLQVKLGHGGTLDPMATGILIVGVGSGTKTLNSFLACTKSYDTVVVFGAATDSYDAWGKLIARAPYGHITKDIVQEALSKFRGKIMQKPPTFSALKANGKPLYEYARKGEQIPIEIQERPVEVLNLELLGWLESGSHEYAEPREEAEAEVMRAAEILLDVPPGRSLDEQSQQTTGDEQEPESDTKRKREDSTDDLVTPSSPEAKRQRENGQEPTMSGALPAVAEANEAHNEQDNGDKTSSDGPESADAASRRSPAPAVRLRMTVTSGFYVRSLAHDLGRAVGSLGFMAALVRTRQGDFELGKNVMQTGDFEKGEEVWAPKVESLLEEWRKSAPE